MALRHMNDVMGRVLGGGSTTRQAIFLPEMTLLSAAKSSTSECAHLDKDVHTTGLTQSDKHILKSAHCAGAPHHHESQAACGQRVRHVTGKTSGTWSMWSLFRLRGSS